MPLPLLHSSSYTSPSRGRRPRQMSLPLSGSLAGLTNLTQKPKPLVEVQLTDDQKDSLVPTYTSSDRIQGDICVTAPTDLTFDEVYITFEGYTVTWVEKLATTAATNNRSTGYHQFLRLALPMADLPQSLEAHKTYKVPFLFVVPEGLLPQSCNHPKQPGFPELGHRRLPPSLGDPMVSSAGGPLVDDMAPEMSTIAYTIRCRLTNGRNPKTGRIITMAEGTKKVRICPAVPEDPPLHVEGGLADNYILRREKGIKKGFGRSKLGRLVMEAAEPKSLHVPSIKRPTNDEAITTSAIINLRFDPSDSSSAPPQIARVTSKMKVATFYSTAFLDKIPSKSSEFLFDTRRGLYIEKIPLSSRCLDNVQWQKHNSQNTPPISRRPSMFSLSEAIPAPSETHQPQMPFYTARVIVPIALPTCKRVFVPTFHSCFVSRVYLLKLTLSVATPNRSLQDPTVRLKLPIQVSQEGRPPEDINAPQAGPPHDVRAITPAPTEHSSVPVSTHSSPRVGISNRSSVAEEGDDQRTGPSHSGGPGFNLQRTIDEDVPPSPGPGWSHRPSIFPPETSGPSAAYGNRSPTPELQQRFGSLSFEGEDDPFAVAPPPEYGGHFGRRYRSRMSTHGTASES